MRQAKEILTEKGILMIDFINSSQYDAVVSAINASREEALREAKTDLPVIGFVTADYEKGYRAANYAINEKIESIINELK